MAKKKKVELAEEEIKENEEAELSESEKRKKLIQLFEKVQLKPRVPEKIPEIRREHEDSEEHRRKEQAEAENEFGDSDDDNDEDGWSGESFFPRNRLESMMSSPPKTEKGGQKKEEKPQYKGMEEEGEERHKDLEAEEKRRFRIRRLEAPEQIMARRERGHGMMFMDNPEMPEEQRMIRMAESAREGEAPTEIEIVSEKSESAKETAGKEKEVRIIEGGEKRKYERISPDTKFEKNVLTEKLKEYRIEKSSE